MKEVNTETNTVINEENIHEEFTNSINKLGRYTSILALVFMLAIPLVTMLYFGIKVNFGPVAKAAGSLSAMFAPMAIVENISYYTVLGAGGVYLSCITGNIMGMKLPAAISGMKIAKVEPGSRKGDIISILCIGISSLVTTAILILGAFFIGNLLAPVLSHPFLKPGFDYIMPALLGAVAVPMMIKSPKIAVTPLIISVVAFLVLGTTFAKYQSYILLIVMLLSVIASYLFYKKGKLN